MTTTEFYNSMIDDREARIAYEKEQGRLNTIAGSLVGLASGLLISAMIFIVCNGVSL